MDSKRPTNEKVIDQTMSFKFEFVKSWDGWRVRSPDNVQFVLRPDTADPFEGNTGIMELIDLYELVTTSSTGDLFFGPQIYIEIIHDDGDIVMRINDETEIITSYEELESETEHLLRESFKAMDASDGSADRANQLQTYDAVNEVYTDLFETDHEG